MSSFYEDEELANSIKNSDFHDHHENDNNETDEYKGFEANDDDTQNFAFLIETLDAN